MSKEKIAGLMINGRLKKSGVTFYTRNGQMIARTATSDQPHRRTRGQFAARQQLAHSCRLWKELKYAGEPAFATEQSAYSRFRSLMRRTPVVFLPCKCDLESATLLLPGMPVSDGLLPTIEQRLGEVDGQPALLTTLQRGDLRRFDTLLLYSLHQSNVNGRPRVDIKRHEVDPSTMVDGPDGLALVGADFGNDDMGWALVHERSGAFSAQTVATRCTLYERYTTEEALTKAAESYGGLTKSRNEI